MLLNLVFEGEDDDGRGAGKVPIADDHAAEIKRLLEATGSDVSQFLRWIGAASVDEMDEGDYERAVAALKRKQTQGEDGR